jgi:hypothetical protein
MEAFKDFIGTSAIDTLYVVTTGQEGNVVTIEVSEEKEFTFLSEKNTNGYYGKIFLLEKGPFIIPGELAKQLYEVIKTEMIRQNNKQSK